MSAVPGRPRKPIEVHERQGTFRADRHGDTLRAPVEVPTCPAFLSKEAKAAWKYQTKELKALGCIASIDRQQLAIYCAAWGEFVRMEKLIAEADEAGGCEDDRLIRRRDNAAARAIKIADRFGFSPSARSRLKAGGVAPEQTDDAPQLFKIRS